MRFSPGAGSHTPRAWAGAAPRLGVATRLLLAFLGISALAVVGAGVAIYSFREIADVLDRITARRVPAALALQEVSRQAERIASAAPALLAAATAADHAESSRKITGEMEELAALLPPGMRADVFADAGQAWETIRKRATPEDLICVAGSVFLAGELRPLMV